MRIKRAEIFLFQLVIISFLCLWGVDSFALTMEAMPPITKDDRILILAPHPDDESIAAGGVIQKAVKAGARVKVVLLTNGENNELSFLVYKKRPVLTRRGLIAMGQVRRGESIAAVSTFGLNENDVVSLGYPDFGMMDVMSRFWGNMKPFRSMLSRVRKVPYENAISPGAPYLGESVLRDLKAAIFSFKPTKIFVSSPADVNRDHRALYLFMKVALWDIDGRISQPEIFPYLVHISGWPQPRGFHPELVLNAPKELEQSMIRWSYLKLDSDEVEVKREAILRYVSQNEYASNYLVTFVRQNELFGDYPSVRISKQMASEVKWQHVSTGNGTSQANKNEHISLLAYARQGNDLLVHLTLRQEIEKEIGLTIFLFGYSRNVPFSQMPKITLNLNFSGLTVKDKSRRLPAKEVIYTSDGKELTFRIPLSVLGNPQRILSTAKASVYNLTLDETAWRELDLD